MENKETYDTMILWEYVRSEIDKKHEIFSVCVYGFQSKRSENIFIQYSLVDDLIDMDLKEYEQSNIMPMDKSEYVRRLRTKKLNIILDDNNK